MLEPDFITEKVLEEKGFGKFTLAPLPAGFGHTLGNTLRRTLLSSLPGLAITHVQINNAVHPFTTISGVKESVLDIILNLKGLRFAAQGDGPFEFTVSSKGEGKITGADFKGGDVEVVNKNHHIAQIVSSKAKLDISIAVEKGIGYSPSEEKEKKEFGMLAIDSVFSPVKKVNFKVEGTRVGRRSNYDKLTLEIWTDDSISPFDAMKKSCSLLTQYFGFILSGKDDKKTDEEETEIKGALPIKVDKKVYQTIIDELDLPTRVVNALLREGIETIEDLIKRGKKELVDLKGVGKKSLDLIEKELEKLSVRFEEDE